jgi:hypothetical protein
MLSVPAKPKPAELTPPKDKDSPYLISGATTVETTINEAIAFSRARIRECKRRLCNGNPTAILSFLDDYPDLIADPWISAKYLQLLHAGRLRRNRGRPRGRFEHHPLMVEGLVRELIAQELVKTPEEAFAMLEQREWLSYDESKRLYYQSQREDRFKAVFVERSDLTRAATKEEEAEIEASGLQSPSSVFKVTKVGLYWKPSK